MSKARIICVILGAVFMVDLFLIVFPIIKISYYSKKSANIFLPDDICYFFGHFDFSAFKEYDKIETISSDENGNRFLSVRTYLKNRT